MPVFVVTYDLNKAGKNYSGLLEAIRRYDHCHALKSAFFVSSTSTAERIRDNLIQHIDRDDALYVMKLQGSWGANRKMPCTDWLLARAGHF